jgi:DNA-binding response OmpR family regulator
MAKTSIAPKQRVLLVEDDCDVASVVCLALEDLFDVTHAATASVARLAIRSACPDVVVLDWHLGKDSGQEVLAELELMDASSRPPVIITSGGEDVTLLEAVQIGAACLLAKPFTLDELVRTVTSQLVRRKQS